MTGSLPSRTGYDELLRLDRQKAEDSVALLSEESEQESSGNSATLETRIIDVSPGLIAHPGQILNQYAIPNTDISSTQSNGGRNNLQLSPKTPNTPFKPSPLRHNSDAIVIDQHHKDNLEIPHSNHEEEEGNRSERTERTASPVSPFSSPQINPVQTIQRTRSGSILSLTTINDTFDRLSRGVKKSYLNFRSKSSTKHHKNTNVYSYEIYYSVFKLPNWSRSVVPPLTPYIVPYNGLLDSGPIRRDEFQSIVKDVIRAFKNDIVPRRIAQGSSGSYFVYDTHGKVVGVFKPQDEEPYGKLSPKWTKWFHRNLFPCFFGRSCLIPNNGYICEAAASVLDRQLQTYIVPFTDIVYLSSPSFYYAYFDRRTLPEKAGSFQLFLHGYEQANVFLREHPLPNYLKNTSSIYISNSAATPPDSAFKWSNEVLQQFREELEKLVILDYIMRNTDRGLDNWMVKLEWHLIDSNTNGQYKFIPKLKIGAIDSGLAFPWKHPDEWRSYPFGWLFLPLALIGQPFSKRTTEHFLPILCSTKWWEETTIVLREMFNRDPDFKERMWKRQLAVIKGQAFNVVETLKCHDQGPLELARRTRCMIWDDDMEIPVSISVSTVQNAIDTPIWESYHDEEPSEVTEFPTIDEEAAIENNPSRLDLTPGIANSPQAQSITGRISNLSPAQTKYKGRKRGGSLALEARFKQLQKNTNKQGTNIWHQLVNSDDLGEPPVDPSKISITPPVITFDSDNTNDDSDTVRLLGPAFEPAIHNVPQDPPSTHLSTEAGWADDELGYAYITGHHATRKVFIERLQTITSKPPVFTWC